MNQSSQEKKRLKEWREFWASERFWTYPELFKVNAKILYGSTREFLKLNNQDRILNIGCGPGFYEALIAPHVESVVAVDTAEKFVRLCDQNNQKHSNVEVHKLSENYTDLSFLGEQRFSVFLCVSVIQYYSSYEEVEALINSAKKIALPGAKMLIADIPIQRRLWQKPVDLFKTLGASFSGGYFGTLLFKVLKEWPAILKYRRQSKETAHLDISQENLARLLKKMGLKAEFLNEKFAICTERLNMLIHM